MKKNITINLFGTLYNIDDDAYGLLERYLDSMKRYFSQQEGGEEIADDIEHRVAELLWEKKEHGMEAVSISDVKEIIAKIGNVNEIDGNGGESDEKGKEWDGNGVETNRSTEGCGSADADSSKGSTVSSKSYMESLKGKRLYRDMSDKMVAGICKGLANFFGGDVVVWRLGTVLMTLLLGWLEYIWFVPVLYLVLCFIVPTMNGPEDRLRMQGRAVNSENLHEEIINESVASDGTYPKEVRKNSNNGCASILLKLIILACCLPLVFPFLVILVIIFIVVASSLGFSDTIFPMLHEADSFGPLFLSTHSGILMVGLVALICVILIPLFALLHVFRGGSSYRSGTKMALIITWVLCLAIAICACISAGMNTFKFVRDHRPLITVPYDYTPDDTIEAEPVDTIM